MLHECELSHEVTQLSGVSCSLGCLLWKPFHCASGLLSSPLERPLVGVLADSLSEMMGQPLFVLQATPANATWSSGELSPTNLRFGTTLKDHPSPRAPCGADWACGEALGEYGGQEIGQGHRH